MRAAALGLGLGLFVAVAVAGCGGSGDSGGGGGGGGGTCTTGCTPLGDPAFLAPHNAARAGTLAGVTVSPAPSPALPALAWSQAAADIAQAWADGCTWAHNPNRGADGTARGENIAASTSALTADAVVKLWGGEWSDYDYASNSCAPLPAQCGHYTQLVWRDTLRVGCASRACTVNSPFGSGPWNFYVCDYEPPGNYVGQWPY
jgi:pathogenesis-related protein 1